MSNPGRRSFLAAAAALPLAPASAQARPQPGAPPATPAPAARLKLSCNLYSFNESLRSGALSLERAIETCAELGFDAVDPTGYYFTGYPSAPAAAYVNAVKHRAFRCGLAISGTGVRNDFTVPDAAKRQADVEHVGRWLAVAARLGAPCLRVFDGPGETAGPTRAQMADWVAEALRSCARLGEAAGVVIVFQNHHELLKTAAEVLALRERVGSEWFALDVDVGSLRTGDPYQEIASLAPFASTWQIKQSVYRNGVEEKTDLRLLAGIVKAAGYRGYLPLETLGPGEPAAKLRRWLDEVRLAFA